MELTFKHSKTFRCEIANHSPNAKTVLYVLHGYGQLAKYFIEKFREIDKDILLVAPEGMHRFYLKGGFGRVGAGWMTKEKRQTDIDDNLSWLNELDEKICDEYPIEKRYVLGFSQGGATVVRWAIHGNKPFDSIIIWASDFPPEEKVNTPRLSGDQNYFAIGNQDEFFNEDDQKELIDYYESIGFNISPYIGAHDIDKRTINKLLGKIHGK